MLRFFPRILAVKAALCLSFVTAAALAIQPQPSQIPPANRQVITGHIPRWADPSGDLGVLKDTQLTNLTVVLARPAASQAAFDKFLSGQRDASSSSFHKYLSPQQVGQQFGPAQSDVASVTAWLTTQGLKVTGVSPDRTRITFNGSSTAIAHAFGTEFHSFRVHVKDGAEIRMAVVSEPSVPANLPAIAAISGLATEPLVSGDHSVDTILGTNHHVMTPTTFAVQYDLTPSYNAGYDGSGVRVAVIGLSRVLAQDITDFQTLMGLKPTAQPNTIIPTLGSDPGITGDQGEQTLDVNRVMSTAPGAFVDLIVSGGTNALMTAASYNVNTQLDPIMTLSYGGCEQVQGSSVVTSWNNLFQTAASEGITVLVSSGDSGAECGNAWNNMNPNASKPYIPAGATAGINYLCASPWATCVGGTSLAGDVAAPATYWTDSGTTFSTLKSYVPEGTFNEPTDPGGYFQVAGSNGGVSQYITKPVYQTTSFTGSDANRVVPDISLTASGHDGYFQCLNLNCENGHFATEEGTSAAAPGMAGIMALIVQKFGKQGAFNGLLYGIAVQGAYSSIYHDVTVASSGVTSCSTATPSICNNSQPGPTSLTSGGVTGFAVATGYDKVTGIGSIDVSNFLLNLNLISSNNRSGAGAFTNPQGNTYPYLTTATTFGTVSNIVVGNPIAPNLVSTTKQGTTDVTSKGYTFFAATISGGAPVQVGPVTVLSPGTYTLRSYWQPDAADAATYGISSAVSSSFTVSKLTPTISAVTQTLPATGSTYVGTTAAFTVTVTKVTGNAVPTGTVQFYNGATAIGSPVTVDGTGKAALASYTFTTAQTASITAVYSGDSLYNTITSAPLSVSVVKAVSTTAVVMTSPTTSTLGVGASATFTATITGVTGLATPTGTVTFYNGATALGTAATVNSSGVATLTTSFTPAQTISITAAYSGDTLYSGSTSSVLSVVVITPTYTVTAAPTTLTITRGTVGNATLTFTPVGGYTGIATYSCSGLPAYSSCVFTPSSITFTGNNAVQTVALQIYTIAPHLKTAVTASQILWVPGVMLAALLFFRRRKLAPTTRGLVMLALLVCAALGVTGCGGNSYFTPTGNATVVVNVAATATASGSSNLNQSASISVTIQ
ncbi:MAG: Ig-like domain repeat protein [Acidobacteriaceae bacterium]|nr:Ig-like domain repeat protein [Acidobacteriaceae bacterium]